MFVNSRHFNRKVYSKAAGVAAIIGFNYHDLLHCTIINMRLAGNNHYIIRGAPGAKLIVLFDDII